MRCSKKYSINCSYAEKWITLGITTELLLTQPAGFAVWKDTILAGKNLKILSFQITKPLRANKNHLKLVMPDLYSLSEAISNHKLLLLSRSRYQRVQMAMVWLLNCWYYLLIDKTLSKILVLTKKSMCN